jgi:predicted ATPase
MPLPWLIGAVALTALSYTTKESYDIEHNNIENRNFDSTFKLGSLYVKKYKMFRDFTINFIDVNAKKSLPIIIIIAGENGTGKTTLLEYLFNYKAEVKDDYIMITKEIDKETVSSKMAKSEIGIREIREEYKKNVKYMKVSSNNIDNIEEYIADYYIDLAEKKDSFSKALKEIQNFISKSLNGLELNFNVNRIDYKIKKVYFKKDDSGVEFGIEELSTGEKTLLSKVLSLFFNQVKNQIILIDEPELSLHPRWQNKILKVYEKFAIDNGCQIIIATHSPHIIASAKNKYLRFLKKDKNGNIVVINDIQAYGRDIEWVLEQMGVKSLRVSEILENFTQCQELLNDEKYDEAEECINSLEEKIGQNDREIMRLRNALFFERD